MVRQTKLQVIFEVGAEGGSITIFGHNLSSGIWRFCLKKIRRECDRVRPLPEIINPEWRHAAKATGRPRARASGFRRRINSGHARWNNNAMLSRTQHIFPELKFQV